MSKRVFAMSGDWALGADSLQWILYRRHSKGADKWDPLSFVSSTRQILERCLSEKSCPPADAAALLSSLPDTFNHRNRTSRPANG